MSKAIFYDYWRSSAAWRVRIGFALKGLWPDAVDRRTVNLSPAVSEQWSEAFRAINPQARAPALILGPADGEAHTLTQSLAILEWLDETHPAPPLLPAAPLERQAARAFAMIIACDIHPLNNVGVLARLRRQFGADEAAIQDWYHEWLRQGFAALEDRLARCDYRQGFLFGTGPSLAEICLVPQLYNARRFAFDLAPFPRLRALEDAAMRLPAFADTAPERQADAPPPG